MNPRDTDPSGLLPPDDSPTAVHPQTPMDLVLHELGALTRKVDALTSLVSTALDNRLSDDQTFANARAALRRLDEVDERCARHHAHHAPTNGSGHG
jgi:hypothetical protein